MPTSPFTDPLIFWSRVLLRLGLVLLVVAVAPAIIDFLLLKGAAVVIAVMAINALLPLAVVSLTGGLILGLVRRLLR